MNTLNLTFMYLYSTRESHEDEKSLLHRRPGQGLPCKRAQKKIKVINMIHNNNEEWNNWHVTAPNGEWPLQIIRSPRLLHSLRFSASLMDIHVGPRPVVHQSVRTQRTFHSEVRWWQLLERMVRGVLMVTLGVLAEHTPVLLSMSTC